MDEDNVKCAKCGSSFNKMFLMGKQGNADVCPLCGADMQSVDEHSDWITWYYYGHKSNNGKTTSLRDKPIDLNEHGDIFFLIKEFKAPPRDPSGSSEKAKEILRTYVPDAFKEPQETPKVKCPYCFSSEVQIVPKKFSLLTGFATNSYQRVCLRCKKKF